MNEKIRGAFKIIITGILLVIIGFIVCVVLWSLAYTETESQPYSCPNGVECIRIESGLCNSFLMLAGILPTLSLLYIILGTLLHIVSLRASAKLKPNLGFFAKSFLAGAVLTFILAVFSPMVAIPLMSLFKGIIAIVRPEILSKICGYNQSMLTSIDL